MIKIDNNNLKFLLNSTCINKYSHICYVKNHRDQFYCNKCTNYSYYELEISYLAIEYEIIINEIIMMFINNGIIV